MKLYAIKFEGQPITEGDWFKSKKCMASSITYFDGRRVTHVVARRRFALGPITFTFDYSEPVDMVAMQLRLSLTEGGAA